MWEENPEVKVSSRGHQRQVFLFKECIVLCKLKRDGSMNADTFTFKNKMKVRLGLFQWARKIHSIQLSLLSPPQLNDVEIKESVDGDEKSWGLWHEHRGSLRRYTLQGRSSLVKLSWLKDLKELQQRSSLPTNSKWEINNRVNNRSADFLVEFQLFFLCFSSNSTACV